MIKESGQVVQLEGDLAWVETAVTSTCQTCSAKSNCGTSSIASAMSSKTVINKVQNHLQAEIGDRVEIGVPEDSLVKGAFLVYILPLILALTFASLSQLWLIEFIDVAEWGVMLGALLGGYLGFRLAKLRLSQVSDTSLEPQLLRILAKNIPVQEIP
jgi:sigma-E factor negative regulatory protein RseC